MYRDTTICLALLAAGILLLWLWSGPEKSPSTHLARTAERALDMAEQSRREAQRAHRWVTVIRIAALLSVTAGPVLVAYLIHRSASREEISLSETLQTLEDEGLLPDDFDPGDLSGKRQLNSGPSDHTKIET